MFVLEVLFNSPPLSREVVLIKRPSTLLGSSDESNITLDELSELGCDLRLTRQLGRTFSLEPEGKASKISEKAEGISGLFDKEAELQLEKATLRIIAIDSDLMMRDEETPDRAGVRILRQAFSRGSPRFPALDVSQPGKPSFCVSFAEGSSLLIGRGPDCAVRIDAPEISLHHARIGYEANSFWVEDLGSTNGTFMVDRQISSRTPLANGQSVRLAQNVNLTARNRAEEGPSKVSEPYSLTGPSPVVEIPVSPAQAGVNPQPRFPCLISVSELCRPARVALKPGIKVQIGREQGCEMWLGAPHVSRFHAQVMLEPDGKVIFADVSSNGTQFDEGFLRKGDLLTLQHEPRVFDFGEGITLAICFDTVQEERYLNSSGALMTFRRKVALRHYNTELTDGPVKSERSIPLDPRKNSFVINPDFVLSQRLIESFRATISALGVLGTALVLISFTLILAILWVLWSPI